METERFRLQVTLGVRQKEDLDAIIEAHGFVTYAEAVRWLINKERTNHENE